MRCLRYRRDSDVWRHISGCGKVASIQDSDGIMEAIGEAARTDSGLAYTLKQLAEDFDYPAIMKALKADNG